MAATTFTIFACDDGWKIGIAGAGAAARVIDVPAASGERFTEVTELKRILSDQGYRGETVVLALPSRWCMWARIATDGLPARNRRRAMTYRLEEQVPVSAEEVAADFLLTDGTACAVCAPLRLIKPLVEALRNVGIAVEAICPAALLALQQRAGSGEPFDAGAYLWGNGSQLDLFLLESQTPVEWYHLPDETHAVVLRISKTTRAGQAPLRVEAIDVTPLLCDELSKLKDVEVNRAPDVSLFAAAAIMAHAVRSGAPAAWFDLTRDPASGANPYARYRAPLTAAAIAAVLFLAVVCSALFWRAAHYQRLARKYDDQQRAVYLEVFPGQPIPLDPASRLASQERKLRAAAGQAPGTLQHPPVLVLLREALIRFPSDVRFRVTELKLDPETLSLQGQARSHADADAVATALRRDGNFAVDLPRTEQAANGVVTFTIGGAPAVVASGAVARSPSIRSNQP